jgi:hypothetical protein
MRKLKLKNVLVASPVLACLLVTSGESLQASGVKNARDNGEGKTQVLTMALDAMDGLEMQTMKKDGVELAKTRAEISTYRGRRALRVVNEDLLVATSTPTGGQALAIVKTSDFKDGTIEADVAGLPREGSQSGSRGFVGIAFRVQDKGSRYETIYLRMTNGRAEDQFRRNHSTQYVSYPDFPWKRLREENPGVYESYVDLEEGAWTKIRIVVAGTKASLYVNGGDQPCLIVNDLKLGEAHGQVALWTGSDTEAYFSKLTVR